MKLSHLFRFATLLAVLSLVLALAGCYVDDRGHRDERHDEHHEEHHDDHHDDRR